MTKWHELEWNVDDYSPKEIQRLLREVHAQTALVLIADLRKRGFGDLKLNRNGDALKLRRRFEDAKRWLFDESCGPLSFAACCAWSGLAEPAARKRLMKELEEK